MTRLEVQALIDSNLASGSNITAIKHREVENGLLSTGKFTSGSFPLGDIPSGGKSFSIPFGSAAGAAPNTNYVVCGSLVVASGSIFDSTSCIFTVTDKQVGGFSITVRELTGNVTQILSFDYAVFIN